MIFEEWFHKEYEMEYSREDELLEQIANLEKENAELKDKLKNLESVAEVRLANWQKYEEENERLKAYNEKLLNGDIEKHNKIVELEKENKELKEVHESDKRSLHLIAKKGANLEREISVLLSCKNCPNNKGGYICQKEYEDKCLAQKIQYIKELKEENAELKDYRLTTLAKQQTENQKYTVNLEHRLSWYDDQLTKAKELLKDITSSYGSTEVSEAQLYLKIKRAEQFLKENE